MSRKVVIGIDEVGLGPIAGPVVVAATVLPVIGRNSFSDKSPIPGLRDSKKLSDNERRRLDPIIKDTVLYWVILGSGSKKIDKVGIDKCWMACVEWCVFLSRIYYPDAHMIVDGNRPIPGVRNYSCIVKADDKIPAVQAASVIAKVFRDELMIKIAGKYPRYGFEQHKGYGTPHHMETLVEYGPCPHHRRSYKPVREAIHVRAEDDQEAKKHARSLGAER